MWWYETRGGFTPRQFRKSKKSAKGANLKYVEAGIGLGRRDDRVIFGHRTAFEQSNDDRMQDVGGVYAGSVGHAF